MAGRSRTGLCHDWLLFKVFYCFGKGLRWKGEGRVAVFFFLCHHIQATISDSKRITKSVEPIGTTSASAPQEIARAECSPVVEVPRKLVWKKKKNSLHGNLS